MPGPQLSVIASQLVCPYKEFVCLIALFLSNNKCRNYFIKVSQSPQIISVLYLVLKRRVDDKLSHGSEVGGGV